MSDTIDGYPENIDITNCDKEPIHLINTIQKQGAILICDSKKKSVIGFSENINEFIPDLEYPLIGKRLDSILSKSIASQILENTSLVTSDFLEIKIGEQVLAAIFHKNEKEILIEFEPVDTTSNQIEQQHRLSKIFTVLNAIETVDKMCDQAAELIKSFTDYDRVMIYKFDEYWNGKIISESKEPHLESWLGLNYPSSDIPKQARALFLKQGVRIISDVNTEPVPVVIEDSKSVDFTRSELRSVSPIHIEYLQNMKVGATMTAAIIYEEKLWGLVACHHYSPRYIDYYKRLSCKFLTQVFSTQLGLRSENKNLEKINRSNTVRARLIEQISAEWNILNGLKKETNSLLDLNEAKGAAAYFDADLAVFGQTPEKKEIIKLLDWIKKQGEENVYHTENLSQFYDPGKDISDVASGILCVFMSDERKDALLWFKPEKIKTVAWGGNPKKSIVKEENRFTPRKSFKKWKEEQKGRSEPWQDYEIASAKAMREHISEIILRKYEQILNLNEKLKSANKELESFSYSVSHDLRAPLRGISGFSQILKEKYYDTLDEFGKSALDTITVSTHKMNNLIDDILSFSGLGKKTTFLSEFETRTLIDEVINYLQADKLYPKTEIIIEDDLGTILGDRSMIFQLYSNLISNALKYSSKLEHPKINIGKENTVYFVKDNGIGFDISMKDKIFGVFKRLVSDEYEGSGIGLAISKRVVEKHKGKIWVDSTPGQGSTFHFTLKAYK